MTTHTAESPGAPTRDRVRLAAPALVAYVAIRVAGLAVLAAWSAAVGHNAHARLVGWDAQWYKYIAADGYGFVRLHDDGRSLSDYAFFPLYPALERLVSELTGLRLVDAGLLVSWIASICAAWGIFAVGNHLCGRRIGFLLTVLWAALPVGIVQSMAYTESLFTALAAWALYAAITGRWIWAGSLAAIAGLTRPVGLAVAAAVCVPVAVDFLRSWFTSPGLMTWRTHRRALIGALIAPSGWLAYVAWVGAATGSPFGYLQVTRDWGNSFDGGAAFVLWIGAQLASPDFVLGAVLCAGLGALGWLYYCCIRQGQPAPLLIFTGGLLFLTLTTSGYFGSKPRYLLPAFPLLLPLAVVLDRLRLPHTATLVTALVVGSSTYGAVWLNGPGPP